MDEITPERRKQMENIWDIFNATADKHDFGIVLHTMALFITENLKGTKENLDILERLGKDFVETAAVSRVSLTIKTVEVAMKEDKLI